MVPSFTQTQLETLLRAFLIQILPQGVEVVIGQINRVPEPTSDNYVIMWAIFRQRMATNVVKWASSGGPTVNSQTETVQPHMQLDFHGADSTDNAQVFATLFRSSYACDFFSGSGIQPDFCTDGQQAPFVNGEQQYEDRWTLNAVFDGQITVSTPQQFADALKVGLIEIDAVFPPSGG